MSSLKTSAFKGVIWSALERFSLQGVQFLVMIVMARVLLPKDYGLIGMTTVFVSLSSSLIDSGFSQALIRKIDRTEVDKSTIFLFNVFVGFAVYLFFFTIAPYVAAFYGNPILISVIRWISLSSLINSFAVVQRAEFSVRIDFKSIAKASIIAAIISGLIGISLAYTGYGVWALVVQQISTALISTSVLWLLSTWRPTLVFSVKSFKELFKFGSNLLISGLLDTLYREIYPIIIGKLYSANSLGHYSRAKNFVDFPSASLTGILQRVTYPLLCEIQNEEERMEKVYRKIIRFSAYIMFPIVIGLASVSDSFVYLTIGPQWNFCGKLLCLLCFASVWYPINAINLNLLQVKGKSNIYLRLEIIKKTMYISILLITSPLGVEKMCYGQIVGSFLSVIINTYYSGRLINFGFVKQIKDILPTIALSIVIFVSNKFMLSFVDGYILKLLLGILVGGVFFIVTTPVFFKEEFNLIKDFIIKKK